MGSGFVVKINRIRPTPETGIIGRGRLHTRFPGFKIGPIRLTLNLEP